MTESERKLMMKMAKEMDALRARVDKIEKDDKEVEKEFNKLKRPVHVTSQKVDPTVGNEIRVRPNGEPTCILTTTFSLANVEHIPEKQKQQDELRKIIIDFCKRAKFQELKVHYKE